MACVLGLGWIFESLHHLIHPDHNDTSVCNSASEIFFRIVDVFNLSRGVLIFIIFVCKESVFEKLKKNKIFARYGQDIQEIMMRKKRRMDPSNGEGNVRGARSGLSTNFTVLSTSINQL